jgi:acetylornithine deacetylase/succinyl-diaminopimelate desuccinylase-like protein
MILGLWWSLLTSVAEPGDAFDQEAHIQESAALLSSYLQLDTRAGHELDGARFLGQQLADLGIPYEIDEYEPGRANLMAKLPGDGSGGGPVCLLSHIDTVDWEPELWEGGPGPLSGTIEDGYIWGRGALDMKGMGIVELQAFTALKQSQAALSRDVWFLAVADEEDGNGGAKLLVERWDELGCAYVLNEGGMGVQDLLFEGQTVYPISVGEKGVLWVRLVAHGEPGHGSTPVVDREAPEHLIRAVNKVRAHNEAQEPEWHPAMLELLSNAGQQRKGIEKAALTKPWLTRKLLKGQLMSNPIIRASMTTTWHVTGLEGARAPNVVPGTSSGVLDIRLSPTTTAEMALAELETLIDDDSVEIQVISQEEAAVSEWQDDSFYEALSRHLKAERPDLVVGPAISPGFTDSIYLRHVGAKAYGLVPFDVPQNELAGFHGPKERVSVENLDRGVRWLIGVLEETCAQP